MIENSFEILKKAKDNGYAIPHFNTNNLEWTRFILEACNELNTPVIIGVSESAIKYIGGYKMVSDIIRDLVDSLNIKIPVVIHLDHGSTPESCIEAIDNGFTSVMFDGSKYSLEENIVLTNQACDYALKRNVTVEAEIGHIGENNNNESVAYAKVEDAIKLAKQTKITSLAPALGSVHGIYKGLPKLDFEKMQEISKKTDLPLVLHGGTGIPDEMIKKAIKCGISKININTELQIAWSKEVKDFINANNVVDPRKIIKSGETAIKKVIKDKVILFGSTNR